MTFICRVLTAIAIIGLITIFLEANGFIAHVFYSPTSAYPESVSYFVAFFVFLIMLITALCIEIRQDQMTPSKDNSFIA